MFAYKINKGQAPNEGAFLFWTHLRERAKLSTPL